MTSVYNGNVDQIEQVNKIVVACTLSPLLKNIYYTPAVYTYAHRLGPTVCFKLKTVLQLIHLFRKEDNTGPFPMLTHTQLHGPLLSSLNHNH